MTIIDVKCEICGHWLAKADIDDLVKPLTGAVFMSRDQAHGFPRPFHPDAEWLFLICPMCKRRAFQSQDFVTGMDGKQYPVRDPDHHIVPDGQENPESAPDYGESKPKRGRPTGWRKNGRVDTTTRLA